MSGIHRILFKNASITFFSRILGFLRDILMARYVGASWQLDAFLIAFKLPNFFRRLFAEGVFSQVLMPAVVYSNESDKFLAHVYAWLCLLVILVSIPFMCFPETMLALFVYGQSNTIVSQAAIRILPWVFPYLGCMAACGYYVVQLNLNRSYSIGSFLPVILNICLIMGIGGYYWHQDIWYLALGVFIAGLLQLGLCIYYTSRQNGVILPRFFTNVVLKESLKQASIGFLAQLISYFSACLDLFLISFLVQGSLSWLYYAERLAYLPVGVVSVVLANMLLNDLSHACKANDREQTYALLRSASHWIVLIAGPAMVGGFFLSDTIVALLFGSNRFDWVDVVATAHALKILSVAMPFLMINRVWSIVPYAFSEVRVQLRINAYACLVSMVVSVGLLPSLGYLAIPYGLLASSVLQAVALHGYIMEKVESRLFSVEWLRHTFFSLIAMTVVLLLLDQYWCVHQWSTKMALLSMMLLKSACGLFSWFVVLRFFVARFSAFLV